MWSTDYCPGEFSVLSILSRYISRMSENGAADNGCKLGKQKTAGRIASGGYEDLLFFYETGITFACQRRSGGAGVRRR